MLARFLTQAALLVLPWPLRRRLLNRLFGFRIQPTARIGWSILVPRVELVMGPGATIGHGNVARSMDRIELGEEAYLGNLNWIYGMPPDALELLHESGRVSELVLREHAQVMSRHVIDCSAAIRVEPYGVVAGVRTQLITHSIDLAENRLRSRAITLGTYCTVGTGCIVLGGAALPPCSALGAGSTLRDAFTTPYRLYSGVPARDVAALDPEARYFSREKGHVGAG